MVYFSPTSLLSRLVVSRESTRSQQKNVDSTAVGAVFVHGWCMRCHSKDPENIQVVLFEVVHLHRGLIPFLNCLTKHSVYIERVANTTAVRSHCDTDYMLLRCSLALLIWQ